MKWLALDAMILAFLKLGFKSAFLLSSFSLSSFTLRRLFSSSSISANKGPYSQSYGFFNSHVRMW